VFLPIDGSERKVSERLPQGRAPICVSSFRGARPARGPAIHSHRPALPRGLEGYGLRARVKRARRRYSLKYPRYWRANLIENSPLVMRLGSPSA